MSSLINNRIFKGRVRPVGLPMTKRTQIFIGTNCNYNCMFCYYRSMRNFPNRPDKVLPQLKFVKEYGMLDVEFTGGEPGYDVHILRHIKDAQVLGFRQICVITNGTRFHDERFFQECIKHGMNEILVSLHGFCEKNHDHITGVPGSWHRAVKTMTNANKYGIILRVNCTVCLLNYHGLEQHADFVKKFLPTSVNYLPVNLWEDAAKRTIEAAYHVMAPRIMASIDRLKDDVDFINVRFIPNCYLTYRFQKYICNWYQHPYDFWDWNNELNDLPNTNIRFPNDPFGYADNVREHMYWKTSECLRCKYALVCDGIEKPAFNRNVPYIKRQEGETIMNPLFARRDYCNEELYNKYIDTH